MVSRSTRLTLYREFHATPTSSNSTNKSLGILHAGPTGNILHTNFNDNNLSDKGLVCSIVFAHAFEAGQVVHLVRRNAVLVNGEVPKIPTGKAYWQAKPLTTAALQGTPGFATRVLYIRGLEQWPEMEEASVLHVLREDGILDRLLDVHVRPAPIFEGAPYPGMAIITLCFDSWLSGAEPASRLLRSQSSRINV